MANIIVAGGGTGGIVAAIKLAKTGHTVTVFEKNGKNNIGLPQSDVFSPDALEYADIPLPESFPLGRNRLTFISSGKDTAPLTFPEPGSDSIIVDRRDLAEYLFSIAESCGVHIIYNSIVISPIILGSRVAGIKTSLGDFYADLVIDACGVDSPLRTKLPAFMSIERSIRKYDVISTYRAYFERDLSAVQPKTDYNIYLKENGSSGFSWVVTNSNTVDVLIVSFTELTNEQVLEKLQELGNENPHIGKNFLYGGLYGKIPVCEPLAILVADGYAALGDSAFMTYSVKGSGLDYSIKAGVMLADTVNEDTDGLFTAESLWDYERRFFKEIGFTACRIALLKNILPYITAEEIDDLLKSEIITTEELADIFENKIDTLFGSQGVALVKEKIKLIRENTILKEKFSAFLKWIGRLTVTEAAFPNKYNRKDVAKWAQKYNEFFTSIQKQD